MHPDDEAAMYRRMADRREREEELGDRQRDEQRDKEWEERP